MKSVFGDEEEKKRNEKGSVVFCLQQKKFYEEKLFAYDNMLYACGKLTCIMNVWLQIETAVRIGERSLLN